MIGPSKAQIEKWTGCTPEELGMQLLRSALDNQRVWDRRSVRWLGTKVGRDGANAT